MSNRTLVALLVAAAVVLLVLNFTMDAGTIYLILAVVAVLAAVFVARRPGSA
ncbi:MAG TPA: hypothetical protein VLB85_04880 [Acidimicrobiia bacterium]|nr:hypothetical protein [Acidimicrobiia bacterium]